MATGLKKYGGKYEENTPLLVRLSLRNLSLDGKILNVPLFMIDEPDSLITIALKTLRSE